MYIVIAGAGLVGGSLAKMLMQNKHDVVVIDSRKESCEKLYAESAIICVHGNAAEIETLKNAGVEKADVVIGATSDDATNLAFSILCQSLTVPKVILRMRNPSYENAYRLSGADSIVRVTDMMLSQIMFEVEQPEARRVAALGRGLAEIYAITIPSDGKVNGLQVKDITRSPRFPEECNFVAVYKKKDNEVVIPRGNQVINVGDELYIIVHPKELKAAVDFLTERLH